MNVNGIAMVIGAGSGIGLECALMFAERGAQGLAIADLNADAAVNTAKEATAIAIAKGFRVLSLEVDVADGNAVGRMVDSVVQTFGRIDYAVNCAGIARPSAATVPNVSAEDFDRLLDVNAKGVLHCLQAEIPIMLKQQPHQVQGRSGARSVGPGSIVTITSTSAIRPVAASLTYVASKYTARAIIKTAALENFKSGLRINEVCPGWTNTPMLREGYVKHPELKPVLERSTPLGRTATVEEIADVCHYLCSPGASYINGQTLVVDAGANIGST